MQLSWRGRSASRRERQRTAAVKSLHGWQPRHQCLASFGKPQAPPPAPTPSGCRAPGAMCLFKTIIRAPIISPAAAWEPSSSAVAACLACKRPLARCPDHSPPPTHPPPHPPRTWGLPPRCAATCLASRQACGHSRQSTTLRASERGAGVLAGPACARARRACPPLGSLGIAHSPERLLLPGSVRALHIWWPALGARVERTAGPQPWAAEAARRPSLASLACLQALH